MHEELKRFEEAELAYRKAIEINPKYAWAWGHLGILFHKELRKFKDAEVAYNKANELEPVPVGSALLGQLLHEELKRFDEAEIAYKKAIEVDPEYVWAWEQLGKLYIDQHKYVEAESHFETAIKKQPQYYPFWGSLIMLKIDNLNNPDEALELADEYLTINKRNAVNLGIVAWTLYASNHPKVRPSAEKWAKMAVEKEPENLFVLNTLASILVAAEKCQEALEVSKQFLDHADMSDEIIEDTIPLYISLVAADCAEEALKQIKSSKHTEALEPLIVGIQFYLGQKVETAQEIQEIGRDVAKSIEQRKLEMKKTS